MCRQLWQPKNKFPFVHFYNVLHCLVRTYVKCSFSGGWKQKKILKLSAEKVVAVAYGRWSRFTRVSSMALTEDIFGVLGRWSPAAGARTWKFDCIITLNLCLLSRNIADILHRGLATTQAIRYFHNNRSPGQSLLLLPPKHRNRLLKFVSNSSTDLRSRLRSW